MDLYSERNGLRGPKKYTYGIEKEVYDLLINTCKKYQNHLIHLFQEQRVHGFTQKIYFAFDEKMFRARLKIRIPELFSDEYNQYAVLDLIEFFALNIRDTQERWNSKYRDYRIIDSYDSDNIFSVFRKDINSIFRDSGLGYKLTREKRIERVTNVDSVVREVEADSSKVSDDKVRQLLRGAISSYVNPNPNERVEAVKKLWDAFERLKTYYAVKPKDKKKSAAKIIDDIADGNEEYRKFFDEEARELTYIGNHYGIRHSETTQKEITDERIYDYLFLRCLAFVDLMLKNVA